MADTPDTDNAETPQPKRSRKAHAAETPPEPQPEPISIALTIAADGNVSATLDDDTVIVSGKRLVVALTDVKNAAIAEMQERKIPLGY